jgi:ParB-like chromosome segregation protein Spo0J
MTVAYLNDPMPFQGEVHHFADLWPMRTADEIEEMAASIAENGQRLPIILTRDGVLVDGRNRLRACEVANVTPIFETRDELVSDEDIEAFIWDLNGDRRDMSKGAKAMLAAHMSGSTRELSSQTGTNNQDGAA